MSALRSIDKGTNELDSVEFSSQGAMPVTLSEVKLWMRKEGESEDVQIDSLIEGVVDEFMRLTNRSLIAQTITVIYTKYASEIDLPYAPVSAITSVKTIEKGDKTTLSADDYYIQGNTLYLNTVTSNALEVVYTSGGSFPNGLKNALLQSILTSYNDREDNVLGGVVSIPNNSRKKALRYKRY